MRFVTVLIGVVPSLAVAVQADIHVVIDSLQGSICGEFVGGRTCTQVISICNPDEQQYAIHLEFDVVSPEGGAFTIESYEYYNDFGKFQVWPPYGPTCDITPVVNGYHVVVSAQTNYSGSQYGLAVSADTVPCIGLKIKATSEYGGGSICIDSAGEWGAWSGPVLDCSDAVCRGMGMAIPNCCFSRIVWCPSQVVTTPRFTDPIVVPLQAQQDMGVDPRPIYFALLQGPGELVPTPLYGNSVNYVFQPGEQDIGQSFVVSVQDYFDYCGDSTYLVPGLMECTFTITVGDDDLAEWWPYPQQDNVAVTGEVLTVPLHLKDDGPVVDDYTFDWYVEPPMTKPAGAYLDPENLTFNYTGQSADTGLYVVRVVLHEGNWADTVGFAVWHFENYIAGDCNHSGEVTISDISWLVSSLYITLVPPAPPMSGEVNCMPGLTIGDISRLVDHLYITQGPLCDPREQ